MTPLSAEMGRRPTDMETSLKSDGYSRFGAENRKISSAVQTRATARAPSLMSLEPPCASSRPIHSVGVCDIMQVGEVGIWKNGTPNRLDRFCIALTVPTENPTPGGQFHKAVIRLFDRYTECAKCGCDRPTSDPPQCVKRRATDRPRGHSAGPGSRLGKSARCSQLPLVKAQQPDQAGSVRS